MTINNFKLIERKTNKYGDDYPHSLTVEADFDGNKKTFYVDLSYSNFELIDIQPYGLPDGISESDVKQAWVDEDFNWDKDADLLSEEQ